jgi:hypothetical protein
MKVTPSGNVKGAQSPALGLVSVGVGLPVAVTVNELAVPLVNVAASADVMAGAVSTE